MPDGRAIPDREFADLDFPNLDFPDLDLLAFGATGLSWEGPSLEGLSFEDLGFGAFSDDFVLEIVRLRGDAAGRFVVFRARLAMLPLVEA